MFSGRASQTSSVEAMMGMMSCCFCGVGDGNGVGVRDGVRDGSGFGLAAVADVHEELDHQEPAVQG